MVLLHTVQSEQPEQESIVVCEAAVFENVADIEISFVKVPANQYRPGTSERFFLGTQDHHSTIFHRPPQPLDSLFKKGCFRDKGILRAAVAVTGGVAGARPEFVT